MAEAGLFIGWGDPVTELAEMAAGTVKVDLEGTPGQAVLVWITDRGDGSAENRVTIQEAALTGVPVG